MKNSIFTAIVDSKKQEEIASNAMRNAIVETIIFNTSVKKRIDEEYYSNILETTKRLINKSVIILRVGNTDDIFKFCKGSKNLNNLQKLMARLTELDCYYENIDRYDKDDKFSGFSWNYSGYNGRTVKCGLFCEDEETIADDEDDEFDKIIEEVNNVIYDTTKKEEPATEKEITEAEYDLLNIDYEEISL